MTSVIPGLVVLPPVFSESNKMDIQIILIAAAVIFTSALAIATILLPFVVMAIHGKLEKILTELKRANMRK